MVKAKVHFFAYGCPIVWTQFIEKTHTHTRTSILQVRKLWQKRLKQHAVVDMEMCHPYSRSCCPSEGSGQPSAVNSFRVSHSTEHSWPEVLSHLGSTHQISAERQCMKVGPFQSDVTLPVQSSLRDALTDFISLVPSLLHPVLFLSCLLSADP